MSTEPIHFIGAGPGSPDLLTLRGRDLIAAADLVLYAGSLVPEGVLVHAREGADIRDSAPMALDEIMEIMETAYRAGQRVARVHSGDPSLYGAVAEQARRLRAADIPYDITPGVSAYTAAAATLGVELTLPTVSQSIILTRVAGQATDMPEHETLENFAETRSTLALHLSIRYLRDIQRRLIPYYGEDCPCIVAYRVGWPDEQFIHGTLTTIREHVRAAKITRTAIIFVGPVLGEAEFPDSALYDADYEHILRHRNLSKD